MVSCSARSLASCLRRRTIVRNALTSVAVALGFRIDVPDVVRDRFLFFFQPLNALDDGLELVLGEFCRGSSLTAAAEVAIGYS